MALNAAFERDDGTPNVPGVDTPWDEWVAASRTRNVCNDDPLLDWLDRCGEAHGFIRDDRRPGYDPRTNFRDFIFRKAVEFEGVVIDHLSKRHQVVTIRQERGDTQSRACVEATWRAMGKRAPDLPLGDRHYRVVDIKFTTLDLLKDGRAASGHLPYMAQVWLYNEALGRLQGFTPDAGFLLGRRWEDSRGRGESALERLAGVDRLTGSRASVDVAAYAIDACRWIRRVRAEGAAWHVLPEPSVPELRPNMRNTDDAPWHRAKAEIAAVLEDLTLLPRVTPERRSVALAGGVLTWTDPQCCAAALGITGEKHPAIVDAVIEANQSAPDGAIVFPARVTANEPQWRDVVVPEFFVDFETVSDLDEDFSAFPHAGGQPLIFMIGCGRVTGPADDLFSWDYRVFTVRELTLVEERRIIEEWLDYMTAVCAAHGQPLAGARAFHWSPAETSFLINAYNAAHVRHGEPPWPAVPWVDLLNQVVKAEPVTVRGAFGFGLKAIARAMHAHRLIDTRWQDSATDGLGAMVGAWSCHHEARRLGVTMAEIDLMREIEAYNEVDCKVMAEVLGYLRRMR